MGTEVAGFAFYLVPPLVPNLMLPVVERKMVVLL